MFISGTPVLMSIITFRYISFSDVHVDTSRYHFTATLPDAMDFLCLKYCWITSIPREKNKKTPIPFKKES